MISQISYYPIFGKPLIMYLGIITFLSFLFTAFISISNRRGKRWIAFKWHPRMAIVSIGLAFIHGLFGLSAYFGF
ncbi:MAG: hypothetical protein M1524_04430 [Patescibacteria group bacterium]|nr:hypothetical protein [Patescibacteria group bacterium]